MSRPNGTSAAMRVAPAIASIVSLTIGCATVNARDQVLEQAVTALNCPATRIELRDDLAGNYVAEGCGRRAGFACVPTQIGMWSCGPAGDTPHGFGVAARVRAKAARLLSCASEEIVVEDERPPPGVTHSARFTAHGCGRAVDYECASQTDCCAFVRPGVHPYEPQHAPEPETQRGGPRGSLPKRAITEVIHAGLGEVRACYEALLHEPPYHTGVVSVKFIIGPDGAVSRAAVARSSLDDLASEGCIVEAVRSLRFPKPSGGGIVVVTYPFVLQTSQPHAPCP